MTTSWRDSQEGIHADREKLDISCVHVPPAPQFLSFPLVSLVLTFVSFVHKDYWHCD